MNQQSKINENKMESPTNLFFYDNAGKETELKHTAKINK